MKVKSSNDMNSFTIDELFDSIGKEILSNDLHASPPDKKKNIKLGMNWFEMKKSDFNQVICTDNNALGKITSDETLLVSAISDLIAGICIGVTPMTVAYLIVKIGLGRLCSADSDE